VVLESQKHLTAHTSPLAIPPQVHGKVWTQGQPLPLPQLNANSTVFHPCVTNNISLQASLVLSQRSSQGISSGRSDRDGVTVTGSLIKHTHRVLKKN
jgi:hypothetical protein